jgi:ABC-type branched-subunit amino acid transport system substrate-binding protein
MPLPRRPRPPPRRPPPFLTRGGAGGPATSGRLIRIDSATNRVESTVGVGNGPSAVAFDESGVWVANHDDGTVWRIDPAGRAAPLKVPAHGKPADLAVSPEVGDTFVSNGPQDANIALLQRENGQPDQILSLFTGLGFPASARVAVGPSGLWIAVPDGRVGRFVPGAEFAGNATLPRPTDERADVFFSGLAVSRDSTWVIGDPNEPSLWRIDAGTGRLAQTIHLPYAPRDVAVGAGGVWVTSQLADRLLRIDPASGRITADVATGRGAASVAVGAGSVWVANAIDHTVMRIDPRNLHVLRTIPVDGAPDDLAVGDGSVWLTAQTNPPAKADRRDIKIGVLAACEGQYGLFYDQSLAGAELPLIDRGAHLQGVGPEAGLSGATIAGRKVRLFFACGDDTARKALSEARRLVESVGVDALIGPTQETESFVIRDYARRHPAVAFLNGSSLGQGVTLKHPAPNLFRFSTDAVQWMAGLGRYAYEQLGWRKAVTVSNSDSFSYTQVAGFVADFQRARRRDREAHRVPTPTPDNLAPCIAKAPTGVDGFVMTGDTPTTRAFVNGVPFLHGSLARKIVGGYLIPLRRGRDRAAARRSRLRQRPGRLLRRAGPARPASSLQDPVREDVSRPCLGCGVELPELLRGLDGGAPAGAREGARRPLERGAPLPGGAREGGARRAERPHPPRREPPGDRRQLPEQDPAREEGSPALDDVQGGPERHQTFGGASAGRIMPARDAGVQAGTRRPGGLISRP